MTQPLYPAIPHKNLNKNVYGNIINNLQKLGITQIHCLCKKYSNL